MTVVYEVLDSVLNRPGDNAGRRRLGLRAEVRAGLKRPGPAPAERAVAWGGPRAMQAGLGGVGHAGRSRRVQAGPGESRPVQASPGRSRRVQAGPGESRPSRGVQAV